ncbi:uncharacterized protein LOC124448789 [Xenia sp. Carnegie-2017]|uniref:uncharacterized protein LOC124448789 n=1 Tax=Xenia sp. Carnegie-2017 TaxID=2897299 RepID=UPI001F034745|nr:uncharacterized protein LOC124448789 [Xenia sp. Carnegie-2017]
MKNQELSQRYCREKSILYDGVDTKDKVEHRYRLQGEEFDKAYTFYEKPQTDHTEVLRKPTKVDKVTVDMKDIEQFEETEEQKYPKAHDVGRILIDETPEDKTQQTKIDHSKWEALKPSFDTSERTYSVTKHTTTKDKIMKVGTLDVIGLEKTYKQYEEPQTTKPKDKLEETFTDVVTEEKKDFRVDKYRQPTHEEARSFTDGMVERKSILYDGVHTKDKVEHRYRLQGEEFDKAYTFYEKPQTDHTEVLRKPTKVDKVTVDMKDIEQFEETEEQKYPNAHDVGRILIDETPEDKTQQTKIDHSKWEALKPGFDTSERTYSVTKHTTTKDKIMKVGTLDVIGLEKTYKQYEEPQTTKPKDKLEETFTDVVTEEKKDFRVDKYRQPTHEEARTITDGIVERNSILYDGVDTKDKIILKFCGNQQKLIKSLST